jgi:hypothetical protein
VRGEWEVRKRGVNVSRHSCYHPGFAK